MAVGLLVFQNKKGRRGAERNDRKEIGNEEAFGNRVLTCARFGIRGLRRKRLFLADGSNAPVQRHALSGSAAHADANALLRSLRSAADMSNLTYRRRRAVIWTDSARNYG